MRKSALVIDTPENCYWCPFSCADGNDTDCGYCELNGCLTDAEVLIEEEYFDLESETKPEWCPLKPLPEKKELQKLQVVMKVDMKKAMKRAMKRAGAIVLMRLQEERSDRGKICYI